MLGEYALGVAGRGRARPEYGCAIEPILQGVKTGEHYSSAMPRGVEWCRDVDYGTLPQWLALVIGLFTIFGIVTAWRSYAKGVNDTHVAQARLCYAVVQKRGLWVVNDRPNDLDGVPYVDKTSRDQIEEVVYPDGSESDLVVDDVEYIVFMVRNNSEEIISDVVVELLDDDDQSLAAETGFATIDPGREQQLAFLVDHDPKNKTIPHWSETSVRIRFDDSAGTRWERTNARPVTEVTADRPGRWKRAWGELWS